MGKHQKKTSSYISVNELRERIAVIEHEQWQAWAKSVYDEVSDSRKERWKKLIQMRYSHLSEKEKDQDRIWANKVMVVLNNAKKDYNREYYDRPKIRKRMKEWSRNYYLKHKDRLDAYAARRRKLYKVREYKREWSNKYYKNNKVKLLKKSINYNKLNKDKIRKRRHELYMLRISIPTIKREMQIKKHEIYMKKKLKG